MNSSFRGYCLGSFLLIWILAIVIGSAVSECIENGNRNCSEEESTPKRALDSCKKFGSCSQLCNDTKGFVRCSCIEGFKLEIDNRTCKAIDTDWELLYLTSTRVNLISGRKRYKKLNLDIGVPDTFLGIDFDAKRGIIFWSSSDSDGYHNFTTVQYMAKFNHNNIQTASNSGMGNPIDVASDWITGNIYLADSKRNEILVCKLGIEACSVLVSQYVNSPQDIVLHPNQGIMFWTNNEGNRRIMRAGMDGTNFVTILQSNLKVIKGLALDQGGSRLYWIDSKFDKLESSLINGRDRRVILAGKRLFSDAFMIDVFGDQVFWGNRKTDIVFSANKFTGINVKPEYVNQADGKLIRGRIFHVANQPISNLNPCDEATCSHICVISPNSTNLFRCICPVGTHIDPRDDKTCVETQDFPKLAIACGTAVHLLPIGSVGKSLTEIITIPGIELISELVYNPVNNSLLLQDAFSSIYEFKLDGKTLRNISSGLQNMLKMDIDVVGGNLYWIDTRNKTLEVMSLRSGGRATVKYGMGNVTTFAITPEMGSAFFIEKNGKDQILKKITLDGRNNSVVQFLGNSELVLTIDRHTGTSFSKNSGRILSVSSTGLTKVKDFTYWLFSNIISENNGIYFASRPNCIQVNAFDLSISYHVKSCDLRSDSTERLDSTERSDQGPTVLAILNKTTSPDMWNLLYNHECSEKSSRYKQCSHICVMSQREKFQGTCLCPTGLVLGVDNKTCEMLPACNDDEFKCHNNKCINMDLVCDQIPDCSQNEDEINCKNQVKCAEKMFHCGMEGTRGNCIPKIRVCNGVRDCINGEDEKCKKYSCTSSEYYCEPTDTCVHKSWLCSSFNSTNKFYECPGKTVYPEVDEICRASHHTHYQNQWLNCGNERFRCYDFSNCVGRYEVCSEHNYCTDGSHKVANMCQSYDFRHRYGR